MRHWNAWVLFAPGCCACIRCDFLCPQVSRRRIDHQMLKRWLTSWRGKRLRRCLLRDSLQGWVYYLTSAWSGRFNEWKSFWVQLRVDSRVTHWCTALGEADRAVHCDIAWLQDQLCLHANTERSVNEQAKIFVPCLRLDVRPYSQIHSCYYQKRWSWCRSTLEGYSKYSIPSVVLSSSSDAVAGIPPCRRCADGWALRVPHEPSGL